MNEPRRLAEDGFDIERQLLRAGALELPSRNAERQAASALGIAGFGATTAAAAAGATKGLLLAKVVSVVAVGAVLSGGGWWLSQRGESSQPAAARRPASATPSDNAPAQAVGHAAADSPRRAGPAQASPARAATDVNETVAPVKVSRAAELTPRSRSPRSPGTARVSPRSSGPKQASVTPSAPATAEVTPPNSARAEPPAASSAGAVRLREEVALMDRARRALAAGDTARALAALDQHQRSFPSGTLGQEAKLLRIEALARSGDRAAARALGERFLSEHPDTPHRKRIQNRLAP